MFHDEYVTVFEYKDVVGQEANPNYNENLPLEGDNMPVRMIESTEWITGSFSSNNMAIASQSSHKTKKEACKAAIKMAKANNREYYILDDNHGSKRIKV